MTYEEECAAVRLEQHEARERVRERELAKPLQLIINELLADRQRRHALAAEALRELWGSPPQGGLSRPQARVGPRNRNSRYT